MQLGSLVQAGLPLSLFMIMLGMGMTLTGDDFEGVGKRRKAFAVGLTSQMLVPPLLAIGLVVGFDLAPELAVGLLVLSFCPSGTTSNLFSYLAGADVALSISLTAMTSLITPFSIPLLTEIVLAWQLGSAQAVPFPVMQTMLQLAGVVLLPVAVGMLWRRRMPASCRRWQPVLHRFSVGLFAIVIAGIIFDQSDRLAAHLSTVGVLCLCLALLALLLGWQIARFAGLETQQVKTVSIEVGMQHGGMALLVTQGVLMNPTMSIVPLTYGLLMLLPVIGMVLAARRGAHRAPVAP